MTALRIFSYLPNPRIMKATIAARLCGIDLEIRGDKPKNLVDWLWDFEAHKLSDNDRKRVDVIAHLGKLEYSNQIVYSELLPGLEKRSVIYMGKIPMSLQGSIVFWMYH